MKGLLLKELFVLQSYIKTIALLTILFTIISITNSSTFLASGIVIAFSMFGITSFSYDKLAKWDTFALTQPLTKKMIVASKYLYTFLLTAIGCIISLLLSLFCIWIKQDTTIMIVIGTLITDVIISILLFDITIPLILKYGAEKFRYVLFIIIAISTLVIGTLAFFAKALLLDVTGIFNGISHSLPLLVIGIVLFVIVSTVVSYTISKRIYQKKEIG